MLDDQMFTILVVAPPKQDSSSYSTSIVFGADHKAAAGTERYSLVIAHENRQHS